MATLSQEGNSGAGPRRESQRGWLIWLLGILAFYPLSTGPVIKIWRGLGLAEQPIMIAYAPLIAASRAVPAINSSFDWYVKSVWGAGK